MSTFNAHAAVALAALLLGACNKPPEVTIVVPPAASQASAADGVAAAASPVLPPQPAASMPTEQQRQEGATLATQGGGGVAPCSSCHGAQGEGQAAAGFPRLAGQSYAYLRHQLASYANDQRNHPVMAPIAKAMTPAQHDAAAGYYAALSNAAPAPVPAAAAASALNARGQQLAGIGDEQKLVQACANCHGPQGIGLGAAYPYLAGQNATYLVNALAAWRDGTRRNDPSGQMPLIAKSLNDADVQAVASFYAQLPPPATPRDADVARSGAAAGGPVVVSGPRKEAAGSAPQGVGTEQGAPLTGGSQGPGGGGGTQGSTTGGPGGAASAPR